MDFPGNSHNIGKNEKPAKEEVKKVVSGDVIQKKKSLGRRFKEVFFGGEIRGATRYISQEVLLPAVKNMVVDATSRGVERVIYGESQPPKRRTIDYTSPTNRSRISYNSPIFRDPRNRPGILPDQPPLGIGRVRQDVGDVILASREEAALVIESLGDIIDKYEVATVADLYNLVGLPSTFVDNKWGWTTLGYAQIRQSREGFLLDLPPVEQI